MILGPSKASGLVALAALALTLAASEEPIYDYPSVLDRSVPALLCEGATLSSEPEDAKPQVEVTLLSLDRSSYSLGDEIYFELRITNVGDRPVVLPVGTDWLDLRPVDAVPFEFLTMCINLSLDGTSDWLTGPCLVGSDARPKTLHLLHPERSLTIRGRAKVLLSPVELYETVQESERPVTFTLIPDISFSTDKMMPNASRPLDGCTVPLTIRAKPVNGMAVDFLRSKKGT